MKEKEIIRNFVLSIKSDIEQIDSGCENCIDNFLEGMNPELHKYGLQLNYNGNNRPFMKGLDLKDVDSSEIKKYYEDIESEKD